MKVSSVEAVVKALNRADVRYLVAGGLAVVAHGFGRFTADLDLVLDLNTDNLKAALAALQGLGYKPRAPVGIEEYMDPAKRSEWVREKGLTVFSLYSNDHLETEIDLFVEPPLDFADAYVRAERMELGGLEATFVSLDDLLRMKALAGRPQDLEDISQLEAIRRTAGDEGPSR